MITESEDCHVDRWRKVLEKEMTKTGGSKSVEAENNVIRYRHDEELSSEDGGWVDEW